MAKTLNLLIDAIKKMWTKLDLNVSVNLFLVLSFSLRYVGGRGNTDYDDEFILCAPSCWKRSVSGSYWRTALLAMRNPHVSSFIKMGRNVRGNGPVFERAISYSICLFVARILNVSWKLILARVSFVTPELRDQPREREEFIDSLKTLSNREN